MEQGGREEKGRRKGGDSKGKAGGLRGQGDMQGCQAEHRRDLRLRRGNKINVGQLACTPGSLVLLGEWRTLFTVCVFMEEARRGRRLQGEQ